MPENIQAAGSQTGMDLSDVSPLARPWQPDAEGTLRPPLTAEGLRLSVALAGATYSLSVAPWQQAGWRDLAAQVEYSVAAGLTGGSNSAWHRLSQDLRLHTLRWQATRADLFSQAAGTLRQLRATDTGKALVMLHPLEGGRYVVAISFMGTVPRVYDWFANFRMASSGGMHEGFLALARQFEENEGKLDFPETAAELGLERLTLADILAEARGEDSRFLLWLVGHSQGGAVMQIYAHHLLTEKNVNPRNVIGYGLASPSVATGTAVAEPGSYPLYHLINTDDVVPRMGAQVHLGLCLYYPAGAGLRRACYTWPRDEASIRARLCCRAITQRMADTEACFRVGCALLRVVSREAGALLPAIDLMHPGSALQKAFAEGEGAEDSLRRFIERRAASAYLSVIGRELTEEAIAREETIISPVAEKLGLPQMMSAMLQLTTQPHTVLPKPGAAHSAYGYIAALGVNELLPCVWVPGETPHLRRVNTSARVQDASPQAAFRASRARKVVRRAEGAHVRRGASARRRR